MGTGTTVVDIRKGVQLATPFYTALPAAEGVDLALGQIGRFIIVGNVPVSGTTPGPGALTLLDSSGNVINSLTGSFINGPWGLAITQRLNKVTLYISNLLDGTVWRLEATINGKKGLTLTSETEIGAGYLTAVNFPTSANGPAGLAYDSKHDILYVASEVDNEVFSIAGASKISSNPGVPEPSSTKMTLICTDQLACCCAKQWRPPYRKRRWPKRRSCPAKRNHRIHSRRAGWYLRHRVLR